mmetsp:Transcript_66383/g.187019  ORF Transcript_66383/g.187019 Transcript_66383/m.187019 type:complete len:226 (+) Transcript_66383:875-1552(+)
MPRAGQQTHEVLCPAVLILVAHRPHDWQAGKQKHGALQAEQEATPVERLRAHDDVGVRDQRCHRARKVRRYLPERLPRALVRVEEARDQISHGGPGAQPVVPAGVPRERAPHEAHAHAGRPGEPGQHRLGLSCQGGMPVELPDRELRALPRRRRPAPRLGARLVALGGALPLAVGPELPGIRGARRGATEQRASSRVIAEPRGKLLRPREHVDVRGHHERRDRPA